MINSIINKLVEEKLDDFVDFQEPFDEIFSGLADDTQASSFLSLLKSKNMEAEFIFPCLFSARESTKKINLPFIESNSLESVNFSSDKKVFNIYLPIDFVCSAAGLNIAKYSFNYQDYSFQILKKMGLNIPDSQMEFSLEYEKAGFYYFNIVENKFFKYAENLIRKLPFESILTPVSKMLSPYNFKNQFIGVKSKKDVNLWGNIALKLNNLNTIVVSGADEFCGISLWGESFVGEAWKNKIFTYIVTPDLLGFKDSSYQDVCCENIEHNILDLEEIFKNDVKNSKYDLVVINSAFALYIAKKVDSIMDGIDLAKKLISEKKVWEKIQQIMIAYKENTF